MVRRAFWVGLLFLVSVGLAVVTPARAPLTFEERVKAQEAIERVYYNHRIWPKENRAPKPPFEEIIPRAALEAKVRDYLNKEEALATVWQRPVAGEQIQSELDRIARESRDTATLTELFVALDYDPYRIAECLAKPILVDRLARNAFAGDSNIHSSAGRAAQAALERISRGAAEFSDPGASVRGRVRYVLEGGDLARETEGEGGDLRVVPVGAEVLRGLLAGAPPAGQVSLEERREAFLLARTLSSDALHLESEWLVFPKVPFDLWWAVESRRLVPAMRGSASGRTEYALTQPRVRTEAACADAWLNGNLDDIPDPRFGHTAVWTGAEMIVWGGGPNYYRTGGHYDPATDTWAPTGTGSGCPSGRQFHSAVWTGTRMIVWGGYDGSSATAFLGSGGIYDPSAKSWTATSATGAPPARQRHTAVWTGSEMIVWGGYGCTDPSTPANCTGTLAYFSDGGRFTPDGGSGTWAATQAAGAPEGRIAHTAIWAEGAGTMVVWGGTNGTTQLNGGSQYDPAGNSWTPTSTASPCPTARQDHTAVWTGSRMIVWGGYGSATGRVNTGGLYDPAGDSWTATPTALPCPSARKLHSAVWTGDRMVVWGGNDAADAPVKTGGVYDPAGGTWTATGTGANCPTVRQEHTAVWATWGSPATSRMIVWGGYKTTSSGGLYDVSLDSWSATSTGASVPLARSYHTAVWTGAEMIVWGGENLPLVQENSGGRYDFATAAWTPTSTGTNCPRSRRYHTAVWTGTEMIVWGGTWYDGLNHFLNDGGRYNPASDAWATMLTPSLVARHRHSAVWTGSEMWVWGGQISGSDTGTYTNTGGRYTPATDLWATMSTATGVPTARRDHTAVWTGTQMVIWGGRQNGPLAGGGKYAADAWVALSGGPTARYGHTAVWAPEISEMIIWGGENNTSVLRDGSRWRPARTVTLEEGNTVTWSPEAWTAIAGGATPAPPATPPVNFWGRRNHTAVWTGQEMLVWGGVYAYEETYLTRDDGCRYNPYANWISATKTYTPSWFSMGAGDYLPAPRVMHTAVWVPPLETNPWWGTRMIVWGGEGPMSSGGAYESLPPIIGKYEANGTGPVLLSTAYYPGYQWLLNGSEIPGATQRTYLVTQPESTTEFQGDFNVRVTLEGGTTCEGYPHHVTLWGTPNFCITVEGETCSGCPTYLWDFGDGTTSTQEDPYHSYPGPGTYTWTLTVTLDGVTCTQTGTIVVGGVCIVTCEATVPGRGSAGVIMPFAGSVTPSGCSGVPTYQWDFGDGFSSAEPNPNHAYTQPGSYNWSMTATLLGASCSKAGTIVILPGCALNCEASAPNTWPLSEAVSFESTSASFGCSSAPICLWDFGDGQSSSGPSAVHAYDTAGIYVWAYTATLEGETCVQTGVIEITAGCSFPCEALVPEACACGSGGGGSCIGVQFQGSATVPNPSTHVGCAVPGLRLDGGAFKGWQWKLDGVSITGATQRYYMATVSGSYTVIVVDAHGGVGTSQPFDVTIFPNPVPVIDGVIQASCMTRMTTTEEFVSYQWKLANVAIPGATDRIYYAPANGLYTVTVTDVNGCVGTSASWEVANYPEPTITTAPATARACIDVTPGAVEVTLTALCDTCENPPITGYQWLQDGVPIPGATEATYNFDAPAPGTYKFKVQVIDSVGCSGTSPLEKSVTINPLPTPTIDGPTWEVCIANLQTTLAYSTYQWYLDGVAIGGATARNHITQVSGSYTVRVTDSNGCAGISPPFVVDIFETVQPVIAGPSHGCATPGVTLSTGEYIAYQWFVDGASIAGATDRTYTTVESGFHLYTVQVEDLNGCIPTSAGLWVNLDPPRPLVTAEEDRYWVPNAAVHAIAESGGRLYLGGEFTQVGPPTGGGVILDATTGVRDASWPKVDGQVYAIEPDGSGGWFLGGSFTRVGMYARQNLARLKADKTVDPAFAPGVNNTVYSMAVSGNTLFVGGAFTQVNGQAIKYLAALDWPTGQLLSWNPQIVTAVAPFVTALEFSGSALYAGGNFTVLKDNGLNVTRNRLASFDFSAGHAGELTPWDPNMGSTVRALAVSGSTLYAGGDFQTVGGTSSRNRLAAFDLAIGGSYITTWNPTAGAAVNALAVYGNTVYAGGAFVSVNGQTRNHIAALNDATDVATPWVTGWNPNLNNLTGNTVDALAVSADGTTVYAGGVFVTVGGASGPARLNLAAMDATTGTATAWDPIASDEVRALALSGSALAAGGDFASVGGALRNRLAELDTTTGEATAWNPGVGGTGTVAVYALQLSGTTLYAGGAFTTVGGATRNRLASFDLATGALTGWNPNMGLTVRCLLATADALFVGGDFTTPRRYLASYLLADGTLTAWTPNTTGGGVVWSLALSGSTLYAGGAFTTIGATARNRLASFDLASAGALTGWNPNVNNIVRAIVATPAAVFAGGDFTAVNGTTANRAHLAAFSPSTAIMTSWNPGTNGTTNAVNSLLLSADGATMYAGGAFTTIGGTARNHIAAIGADPAGSGALVAAWDPDAGSTTGNTVNTLFASGGVLLAGGKFTALRGIPRTSLGAAPLLLAPCGTAPRFATDASSTYQWMRGGVDIAGATSQSYLATTAGSYSVRVTDARGCAGTSPEYPLTLPVCGVPEVSPEGAGVPARIIQDGGSSTGFYLYFEKVLTAAGYNIYEGILGTYYSHGAPSFLCGAVVTDLGTGEMRAEIAPTAGDHYYLVTAHDGSDEGPSGYDSDRAEIDPAQSTCGP